MEIELIEKAILYGPMIRRVEYLAISLNTYNITVVLSPMGRAAPPK